MPHGVGRAVTHWAGRRTAPAPGLDRSHAHAGSPCAGWQSPGAPGRGLPVTRQAWLLPSFSLQIGVGSVGRWGDSQGVDSSVAWTTSSLSDATACMPVRVIQLRQAAALSRCWEASPPPTPRTPTLALSASKSHWKKNCVWGDECMYVGKPHLPAHLLSRCGDQPGCQCPVAVGDCRGLGGVCVPLCDCAWAAAAAGGPSAVYTTCHIYMQQLAVGPDVLFLETTKDGQGARPGLGGVGYTTVRWDGRHPIHPHRWPCTSP